MKKFILASTMIIALLTVANARGATGGATGGGGGMRLHKDTPDTEIHHQFRGSALHETAAAAHRRAADHHEEAAAMYRKKNDANAIRHAEMAIDASDDAFSHTEDTKVILPTYTSE